MSTQNPAQYARVAADVLERLVREVRTGQAEWAHPQFVRQGVDDLMRITDAAATVLQQLAAASGQTQQPGRQPDPAVNALLEAGRQTTAATTHLRQARRTLH
ncbi:hypothetical protein [Streptomyces griseofuscus]|uniref:hypothetical protein n=1 Tax=Streptomyces griseofuscus TaxID=146922 RepID=UPI0033D3AF53